MSGQANRVVIALLALLTVLAVPASAFWRLPCKSTLVVERADPIVSPGEVSGHVHTIMGGNGFGFKMTYDDTQKSTCSSCMVTKDFSNYWVPKLYYKAENGTFIDVGQNGGATIYYLQRSDSRDPYFSSGLLAFPEGFRMVAGNPFLRNYTGSVEQQAISFSCLGTQHAETNNLPNYNCPNGLRAQVFFPSCWDGMNLDSPNHKSHMSYPSVYNSGSCPPSHPKRFISIFIEVIWNTFEFMNMWWGDKQPFVFAMGDDTGYGYHGDFVNGWDVPTLQRAINTCLSNTGNIEDCHEFKFFSDAVNNGCKIPASVHESVTGVLPALPGCNAVQSGPGMAVPLSGCGATTTIGAPQNNFIDLTVTKNWSYLGCGYDIAGQARTLTGPSLDEKDMSNEKCIDFCASQGYNIAGTEYSTQCFCGNSFTPDRAPVPGILGNCVMPCAGNGTEICGGASVISLYKKCGATCHNVGYYCNPSIIGSNKTVTNVRNVTSAYTASVTATRSRTRSHIHAHASKHAASASGASN